MGDQETDAASGNLQVCAAQLKSAVVNTASQTDIVDSTGNQARVTAVGAGKLKADDALNVAATLSPATLSFGLVTATTPPPLTLNITNVSAATATFTFTVQPVDTPSATVSVAPTSLTLTSGQTNKVTVSLNVAVRVPLRSTMGDDFAAGFVRAEMLRERFTFEGRPSGMDRSRLYSEPPSLFSSGRAFADDKANDTRRLSVACVRAVTSLINHPNRSGHHDDLSNVVAGAFWRASSQPQPMRCTWADVVAVEQYFAGRRAMAGAVPGDIFFPPTPPDRFDDHQEQTFRRRAWKYCVAEQTRTAAPLARGFL